MKRFLTIGAIALLSLAACNQQSTPTSKVVGTLELTLGGKSGASKAVLHPLASTPVADTAITVGAVTNVYGQDANFRYITAQFSITANQAFSNLTLYAYNKTGNLGGTAVKNLVNFTGGAVAGTAQNLIPINARNNSGAIVTTNADFQAFTSADIVPVQAFVPGETVLQYGFVARKDATTRAFASGNTGSITVAYKIPITAQNDDTYKFTATFVVADETNARVTRDIDESATQADARAAAFVPPATEVMLIGVDTQGTPSRSGGLRYSNIQIGTNTKLLPDPALAVYRVGDGSAALSGAAAAVFIDKFTTTGTVQTPIPMPIAVNGANLALVAAGSSTSEGGLTLSENGRCLVATGYNATPATASISGTTSAAVNRVVAVINSTNVADTTTGLTDAFNTTNIRGATSSNCNDIWISGASGTGTTGGSRYTTKGTVGTSTQLATTPTNLRFSGIFAGQLYVTTGSGTTRMTTVGTGTPTTTGQTIANINGSPTTTSPYGFFFADLNSAIAGVDTLYLTDDSGTANIAKYSLFGGTWTANGSITLSSTRGLTGIVDGTAVQLFMTNGTTLQTLTDTSGYNATITGSLTSLATAATNTAYRGVALQPR